MCNLNTLSQILRVVLGLVLIALAWFGPKTTLLSVEFMDLWRFGWLGIIPLISGIAAFCPIYAVLGFGHHKENKGNKEP